MAHFLGSWSSGTSDTLKLLLLADVIGVEVDLTICIKSILSLVVMLPHFSTFTIGFGGNDRHWQFGQTRWKWMRWDAFSKARKWCWSVSKNRFANRRATWVVYHCVIFWGGSESYLRVRYLESLQLGAGRQATLWATVQEHRDQHDIWID